MKLATVALPQQKYACLPARTTTDRPVCRLQSDCYNPSSPSSCVVPSLDNSTKLLRVMHLGRAPLLFLGHPLDLHYAGIHTGSCISLMIHIQIQVLCGKKCWGHDLWGPNCCYDLKLIFRIS